MLHGAEYVFAFTGDMETKGRIKGYSMSQHMENCYY